MIKDKKVRELQLIGQECKMIRVRCSYSQQKVAMLTGFTQQTVSQFELGYSNNLILYLWYQNLKAKKGI